MSRGCDFRDRDGPETSIILTVSSDSDDSDVNGPWNVGSINRVIGRHDRERDGPETLVILTMSSDLMMT